MPVTSQSSNFENDKIVLASEMNLPASVNPSVSQQRPVFLLTVKNLILASIQIGSGGGETFLSFRLLWRRQKGFIR